MKATTKEALCIDFSKQIRQAVIERKINEFKEQNKPQSIFLTPNAFLKEFNIKGSDFGNSFWKDGILMIVAILIYLLLAPLLFFAGLYELIFKRKSSKKESPEIQLNEIYHLDDNVSDVKSFSQLWDDKGLRDYGQDWWKYIGYTKEEQRMCIYKWFEILYDQDSRILDKLVILIEEEHATARRQLRLQDPKIRVTMASIESVLPERIDTLFGEYKS